MSSKRYEKSIGNVYKDLGLPDAEELVKAKLVWKIDAIMKERGLKQVEVAALFGVWQPDVSKMRRGEFQQFSVERLLQFLAALGQRCGNRSQAASRQKRQRHSASLVIHAVAPFISSKRRLGRFRARIRAPTDVRHVSRMSA